METLGARIRIALAKAKSEKGITAKEIAKAMGIHPNSLGFWQRNEKEPGVNKIKMLAHYTDVDLVWLMTGKNPWDYAQGRDDMTARLLIAEAREEYHNGNTFEAIKDFLNLKPEYHKVIKDLIEFYKKKEGEK